MDPAGAQALRAFLEGRRDELLALGLPPTAPAVQALEAWIGSPIESVDADQAA